MKRISLLMAVALACLVAAVWFARSGDEVAATQVAAVPSGFDTSPSAVHHGETPQQQWQQRGVPQEGRTDRIETESAGATAATRGNAAFASTPGQSVSRGASGAGVAPSTNTNSPPSPPAVDKTACEAAARILSEASAIYDVTAKEAIWYSKNSPPAAPSAFYPLQARLLAPLCSGIDPFEPAYPVESEFVAISADAYVRIFVGDHWISEGTVLSFLSESDQNFFTGSFLQQRRQGPGPNRPRNGFDRMLAKDPQSLINVP